MKKLTLILITILALNLACDDDNNDGGNGDDPTNGTKDPTTTTISIPENLSSDETGSRDGAYTLSWDSVTDAAIYKLREGETELSLSSDDVQNRTHSVTGKMNGSYSYQVRACDANNTCSEWSSAITVHVFTSSAPTLTSDETSSRDGAYTLSWDSVTDAAIYKLREGETELSLSSDDVQNRTHSVTGKMNGSYSYQVRACDANNTCSEWSSAITVHVFTSSAPTLTSDETSSTDGAYDLSWDAVTDAAIYKLREGETELSLSSDDVQNRTHSVTGKMNGSYSYSVRACDANDVCSEWSSAITVNVFTASAPMNLSSDETSSGDGAYTLTWNSVSDAATYELQEGVTEIYSGADPTHSVSGKADGEYNYRVRACHSNGVCSPWSNTLSLSVSINCAESSPRTSGFHGGDGSSADPYLICNYTQLDKIRDSLTSHYKLGAHIDASASHSAGAKRGGGTGCTAYDSAVSSGTAGHPNHDDTCTGWAPVGDATTAFTGSLQGAHYTIRNLYISIKTTTTRVGLFGQTGSSSVIQNVGVTNAYIQVDTASSRAGGLVGLNQGSLSNSYATGSVTASGSRTHVGGLVGENQGSLSNSYASSSVTASGSRTHVGGLVGRNTGSLSNNYATGSVTASGSSSGVGGLVGLNTAGSLSNNYATGSVTGTSSSVGGLLGLNTGSLSNSYATGSVSGSSSDFGGLVGNNSGSLSGKNYYVDSDGTNGIGAGTACTTTVCIRATGASDAARRTWLQDTLDESTANSATPAGLGWSATNWGNLSGTGVGHPLLKYAQVTAYCSDATRTTRDACEAAGATSWLAAGDECDGTTGVTCGATIAACGEEIATGAGTAASPYLICNYDQLDKMRNGLTAHYKLVRHIDASDSYEDGTKRSSTTDTDCKPYDPTLAEDAPTTTDGHPSNGDTCTGWVPLGTTVGTVTSTAFTGSLQGAGYEIRNLYLSISTTIAIASVGLFGQTGRASLIQNLGLTDAYIQVGTTFPSVGGLVGGNAGSVSNSYATGSVTTSGSVSSVGGLVGWNSGSISNSYATTSVSGSSSNVGGLVGNNSNGSISNSYATGSVIGSSITVGGLVGWNDRGSLRNSYATGSVTASGPSSLVGGLVGQNAGNLSNSYATGSVTGSSTTVGGLVGRIDATGSFSGKNYFVYIPASDSNMNGIGGSAGFCGATAMDSPNVCIRAGTTGQSVEQRRMWLHALDENTAMGWPTANWENFTGADIGYPLLKYAAVAGFCSDGSDKNENACKTTVGSCGGGGSGADKDACEMTAPTGTWMPTAWWLAGGDECDAMAGGTTGVVCGARIGGQD